MFRRRRQLRKLRRVAQMLLELDPGANRLPATGGRSRLRGRMLVGR
jgi:hypothetical protein